MPTSHSDIGFEPLAQRHRAEILAYLYRLLGDAHDAEDACQEALLRAYRAFPRLAPESNGRAWLYKIATRTALNMLKRRNRSEARHVDIDLERLSAIETDFDQRERLRAVAGAVEALPPKQRAALMQRQFQGLSYAEIAQTLDCSEAAARANVYQALKKLREALPEEVE
jgi:RNA polymerase sigma-70 factor (ECF subfamily)